MQSFNLLKNQVHDTLVSLWATPVAIEVILGTDDETSSKDDTSSNDEISSSEDLINYLFAHDVECVIGTNRTGKAHYELRSLGPLKEEMVHVKKLYNMVKVTNVVLGLKASNS
ncbi:hypothetical protein Tco_0127580 [Tanacetum coccineum]